MCARNKDLELAVFPLLLAAFVDVKLYLLHMYVPGPKITMPP